MSGRTPLPIDTVLPALADTLSTHNTVVLSAPPGSGKTTRVPPAVANLVEGRVLLLQPRRVAARACAHRIAFEDGSRVGARIGYHVRFEKVSSTDTKILVLTEGMLTGMIQNDPFLEGIDAVILDEFHERSIHSDMALSMLAEIVADVRPDLKLIIMSATLNAAPIQAFFGGPERCPSITASGRCFEVSIAYRPVDKERWLEPQIAAAIQDAIAQDNTGHVLVFLPGVGEIERVRTSLGNLPPNVHVLPLHGRLSAKAQDLAIANSATQKVVLATNIAETSLTIDGVTTVVDSGLARRPRFDQYLGMERLELVPISVAAADQRAGRAGRTRPGRCVRMWSKPNHSLRAAHDVAAVQLVDMTPSTLALYAWGTTPAAFRWFEAPPEASLTRAKGLLEELHAIEGDTITRLGQSIAGLPVHPRLARVVLRGQQLGVLHQAAGAAALASERDPWPSATEGDLLTRLDWMDQPGNTGANPRALTAARLVRDDLIRLSRRIGDRSRQQTPPSDNPILSALIAGFPDRVGRKRSIDSREVLLASGVGVKLAPGAQVGEWMVAITITAGPHKRAPLIRVAATLNPTCLVTSWAEEVFFDKNKEAVVQRTVRRWGAIVIAEKPSPQQATPSDIARVLEDAARPRVNRLFPLDGPEKKLLARLRFAARARPEEAWPSWLAEPTVLLNEWCMGRRSFAALKKLDVAADLLGRIPWDLRKKLDQIAPERMRVPSGSMVQMEYPDGAPPVLAARVQQMFGMLQTPTLGGVPVTVHLLAPNGRPTQVTSDLAHFWANSYALVRKDLRGRYPRHAWPEDPSTAIPENRPRKKRQR